MRLVDPWSAVLCVGPLNAYLSDIARGLFYAVSAPGRSEAGGGLAWWWGSGGEHQWRPIDREIYFRTAIVGWI